ncbi:MAG: efflux RND transporter periplasmic adaptor subunit, partial [Sphingobacteriales bacterium]
MPELSSRSRRFIWGTAAVLVVTALGAMFWPRSNGPDYVTETLATGDIENLVTATGSLQPREYVDVGAQVSGQ